ncbi:MAG: LysM peptidoglycan-binding domain-containing protein [Clostridia bacterium]|nr:LysM peptidoglycan-binding domain-containing protein [Clostridia bacterium]
MIIHTVKSGESLYSIGADYGISPALIAQLNGIAENGALAVGQALILRFPRQTHIVRAGDSLYSIAAAYGVTVNALFRANPALYGGENLWQGQSLVISYTDVPELDFFAGGYAYTFTPQALLNQTMPFINVLIPFTYGFRSDGSLYSLDDSRLVDTAKRYGAAAWMHLSTYTEGDRFDTQLATDLLASAGVQELLQTAVKENMVAKGYDGLDVDFEFIGRQNAAPYADFLEKLTQSFNADGYTVAAALAPKTRDDQTGDLYEGHDYAAVAAAVNYVLLMTYEWGYTFGPPLAISPLPSVKRVVEYALTKMPAEKILLGISNYGYDWTLPYNPDNPTAAPSLSTEEAVALALSTGAEIQYDEEAQAPYFYYYKDGVRHEVWYEDVRSINARLQLIPQYGLRGCLYWNLTRPNTGNLSLLAAINKGVNQN